MVTQYYDYKKAVELVEKYKKQSIEICMGMAIDWFWTGTTIWEENEGYIIDIRKEKKPAIAGIFGSSWDIPIMRIYMKNGETIEEDIHTKEKPNKERARDDND